MEKEAMNVWLVYSLSTPSNRLGFDIPQFNGLFTTEEDADECWNYLHAGCGHEPSIVEVRTYKDIELEKLINDAAIHLAKERNQILIDRMEGWKTTIPDNDKRVAKIDEGIKQLETMYD